MIPLAICKISIFLLVSEAKQSGLSLSMYLVANHEDRFSRDAAQAEPCHLKMVLVAEMINEHLDEQKRQYSPARPNIAAHMHSKDRTSILLNYHAVGRSYACT